MERLLLRDGEVRRLVWGADSTGTFRAKDYFDSLDMPTQIRFLPWFDRLADTGLIRNCEVFRPAGEDLHGFQVGRHRLLCFFDATDVVLVHGFLEKGRAAARGKQVALASRIRDAQMEAANHGEGGRSGDGIA